jgi:hypothetical protein
VPTFHDLGPDETLRLVGLGTVEITLRQKSGRRARLEIHADQGVTIHAEDAKTPPANANRRRIIGLTRSG